MYTGKNVYFSTFIKMLYPQRRNYTGRTVHEAFGNTIIYTLWWCVLLSFKVITARKDFASASLNVILPHLYIEHSLTLN